MPRTVLAALVTIGVGLLVFAVADQLPPKQYTFAFGDTGDPSTFTTIFGTPFVVADGAVTITEPMAHLRLPFGRTVVGKRLVLDTRFRVDGAEVFAVGVKKGDFWLDYDRHVLLDRRGSTAAPSQGEPAPRSPEGEVGWIERREVLDLNRAYLDQNGALELMVFLKPEEGQRTLTIDELRIRVEPGPMSLRTLAERARLRLSQLRRRPLPSPSSP